MAKINILGIIAIILAFIVILLNSPKRDSITNLTITPPLITSSPVPQETLPPIPDNKILENGGYHIFQTFNNCGPAALSMTLSYYGIIESQSKLGSELRPYQIKSGINDDKSVTLSEIAEKSRQYGFTPYLRPNGTPELLINFIAQGIPVLARTWTGPDEDIGHFRVIKGYNSQKGILIQDDSLQGKNLEYTYANFNEIWEKFNFEYLVMVPDEKIKLAELIIDQDLDEQAAWNRALINAQNNLLINPEDIYSRFNLSIALYHTGRLQESVDEFEKIESRLPFRTLWYQIEPIEAYYKLKNYNKVFTMTDKILNGGNRAYSEVYRIRGNIYNELGETIKAAEEFRKAELYSRPAL